MIRALDRGVGRVLDALRANGLEENTLVIFTSDNGGADYIGLPDINRPYRGLEDDVLRGRRAHAVLRANGRRDFRAGRRSTRRSRTSTSSRPPPRRRARRCRAIASSTASTSCRSRAASTGPSARRASTGARATTAASSPATGSCRSPSARPRRGSSTWTPIRPSGANLAASRPDKVAELSALLAQTASEMVPPTWPSLIEGADRDRSPARVCRCGPTTSTVDWAN